MDQGYADAIQRVEQMGDLELRNLIGELMRTGADANLLWAGVNEYRARYPH